MPPTATATKPRDQLDEAALAEELEVNREGRDDDDGLGPTPEGGTSGDAQPEVSQEEYDDPNSEFNTGVPGGRKPGDDGYIAPSGDGEGDEGGAPPTPPADLAGAGDDDEEDDQEVEAEAKSKDEALGIIGDRELGLKVGGRKPDSATLHLKGGKIELRGPKGSQFNRGDRFLTVSTLQVTGDNDQDTIVKNSGEVTSTSKKQNATLCGISRLEDWLAERLRGFQSEQEVEKTFEKLGLELPELES